VSDGSRDSSDEALSRQLATELPRYAAPARLRAAIVEAAAPGPARVPWLVPAVTAAATALVLVLFFVPLLPHLATGDPVQRMTRAVVSEHMRVVMWGARRPDPVPAALPQLRQETGIELTSVFPGDDRLQLQAGEPVYLEQRRGLALYYSDEDGHHISYIALPGPGLTVPERQRVQVDRWRPALLHDNGFSVWVWKHGELVCFMVSDMVSETDMADFKDYFVRVRGATEPVPARTEPQGG
jgi:hypothetical protein